MTPGEKTRVRALYRLAALLGENNKHRRGRRAAIAIYNAGDEIRRLDSLVARRDAEIEMLKERLLAREAHHARVRAALRSRVNRLIAAIGAMENE